VLHRGFRYALRPTPAQAQTLREWVGVTRLVYNLALEQRRDFWRQYRRATGMPLTWVTQSRELTDLRAQFDWIEAVPRGALDRAFRELHAAYVAFFTGRAGYPSPRVKGRHDSFGLQAKDVAVRRLNAKWSAVRLPKLGWVKFRDTRPALGRPLSISLALRAGRWTASFARELEHEAQPTCLPSVGIDRGVAQTLMLSTGEAHQAPNVSAIAARRARAQRAAARGTRGSARNRRQKAAVAALSARAARIRADWCHRTSTDIARRFGVVAIEDLKITNMTAAGRGKRGLNRSILEQCWGKFARFLDYKLTERGGVLISVPAAYTSQTCAGCGVVDARSRKSQAVFACVHCSHEDNADVNAAKEILRRSTALLDVEGSHWGPAEASIMAAA
jgi:putative transposase